MYKRIGYSLSILITVCILVLSMNGKGMAAGLRDIPANYSSEINFLINRHIINGYPDGTFKPDWNVSREEAMTMVGRAIGLNGKERATSFKDVKAGSYSSGYIQSALEKNIIALGDGKFRPIEKMTRGEMALWLEKAFNLTKTSDVYFSDVPTSGTVSHAINTIVTAGLANGYPDASFKPENPITRAEFSLLIARGLDSSFRVSATDYKPIGERIVTADSLNVRKGPGIEYAVIGALPRGSIVTYYYGNGDWVYITYGSTAGFVHRNYLAIPNVKHVIAIDAGHGDHDPGAVGNGIKEKDVNLAIALKVEKLLDKKGIQVVMTRTDDTYLTLQERVDVAVNKKADAFVSIHANSNTNSSANGTETYFSTAALSPRAESSKQLATFIQNRLYKALGTTNRGVKEGKFHVIYKNPLPSALVELGFISNASDAKKLASDDYRNRAAEAIASGIEDYYNWKK